MWFHGPRDKQPEEAFAANKARGALIIPEEYGRQIARGAKTPRCRF